MESLTQILEEELENSFEVKDRKALHRSVILLVENLVGRERHQTEFHTLQKDIGQAKDELKTDMANLKGDMADLRNEMKGDIADLRNEIKGDMADFKDEMKSEIAELTSDVKVLEKTMSQGFTDVDKRLSEAHQSQNRVTSLLSIVFIVFGVLITVFEFIR